MHAGNAHTATCMDNPVQHGFPSSHLPTAFSRAKRRGGKRIARDSPPFNFGLQWFHSNPYQPQPEYNHWKTSHATPVPHIYHNDGQSMPATHREGSLSDPITQTIHHSVSLAPTSSRSLFKNPPRSEEYPAQLHAPRAITGCAHPSQWSYFNWQA